MTLDTFLVDNKLSVQLTCITKPSRDHIVTATILGTDTVVLNQRGEEAFGGWSELCDGAMTKLAEKISGTTLSTYMEVPILDW